MSLVRSALHPPVRSTLVTAILAASLALGAAPAVGVPDPGSPGAPGAGDPYFPTLGNGGYEVTHYDIDLSYTPSTDLLRATTTARARATQRLSAFDLDLHGLTVRSVQVDGKPAAWSRDGDELRVVPSRVLADRKSFSVVVAYDGVPAPIDDPLLGLNGWIATDDGAVVVGQPYGASTWFPVNDHPSDKATYSIRATVPTGLEVAANGRLVSRDRHGATTTWSYDADDPMASYLATVDIGRFRLTSRSVDGIDYLDAVAEDLYTPPVSPADGTQFAWSQQANDSYKRLARTFEVPAGATGAAARLSFQIDRDTELDWDYVFVEAAPSGTDHWTTLPDASGATGPDTGGASCSETLAQHPFLAHYLSSPGTDEPCDPTGTTGTWSAATGESDGWEEWSVDLSAYAGGSVDLAISFVSDLTVQAGGVAVDDVVGPGGQGSTSFEGGDLAGWTVPGAPDATANENDWVVTSDGPPTLGESIDASLAREPEIVTFLSEQFGPYPWKDSGAIVPALDLGFALETQTRPVYSPVFWRDGQVGGDFVIVHELAHQWFGDSVALERWQDIWLNEGFATYAEWLWDEHEFGTSPRQHLVDDLTSIPADDEFWDLPIGDPGPAALFYGPVYERGAMTLQALRDEVGDATFFRILRRWAADRQDGHGTTPQFVALAEKLSGRQLDALFETWLSAGYPGAAETAGATGLRSLTAPSGHAAIDLRKALAGAGPRR